MTTYGLVVLDRAGIPLIDEASVLIKLHEEGIVTVPAQVSAFVQGVATVNFTPCTPLPIITILDIDDKVMAQVEDFATFVALQGQDGNNQFHQFKVFSYAGTSTDFKWRVWIRNDV